MEGRLHSRCREHPDCADGEVNIFHGVRILLCEANSQIGQKTALPITVGCIF